jgi:site-specific recombinase XerD
MISSEEEVIEESGALLGEYEQSLSGKARGTKEAYLRTVRHLIGWVGQCPGNAGRFEPPQLTPRSVEMYLTHLEQEGLSLNHRARVKSTISNFAKFLIEEKGLLQRNPTRSIELSPRGIERTYVFTSQRSERLTEEGIYYWFRTLKAQASEDQWEVIEELSFHDLRHDFAQRAREAGWSPEEVASYLGDVSKQGVPTIHTSVRSTRVSQEQVKLKLKDIKG